MFKFLQNEVNFLNRNKFILLYQKCIYYLLISDYSMSYVHIKVERVGVILNNISKMRRILAFFSFTLGSTLSSVSADFFVLLIYFVHCLFL